MFKLVAVYALLVIAFAFDLGELDEGTYESLLREQGFSEEDIQQFVEKHREHQSAVSKDIPWHVARGYRECPEYIRRCGESCTGCLRPRLRADICDECDCPESTKVESSACGFNTREFARAKWASTPVDTSSNNGYTDAFWRLFKYINKANDQGVRMAKRVYMVKIWSARNHIFSIKSGMMAVYLPSAFQASPPTPTDDQVTVEEWDEFTTYSRAYGGAERSDDRKFLQTEFNILKAVLAKEDITPDSSKYMIFKDLVPGCAMQRTEVTMFADDN